MSNQNSLLKMYFCKKDGMLMLVKQTAYGPMWVCRHCEYSTFAQGVVQITNFKPKQARDKKIPLSGHLIRSKAEQFATEMGKTDFKASSGWLDGFKERNKISFKTICGESGAVNLQVAEQWKNNLRELIQDKDARDVFNLPLLMIGKAVNPRCFKNVKTKPVDYANSARAWMTSYLFEKWLLNLDKKYTKEKRKFILFIDNCTAHNSIPPMENVEVIFFPANMTSVIQPMDKGVIKNLKHFYRRFLVENISTGDSEALKIKLGVLQASRLCKKAWDQLTSETIKHCFKKAGFVKKEEDEENADDIIAETMPSVDGWEDVISNPTISYDDFLNVDAVCGEITDADIIAEVLNHNIEKQDGDEASGDEDESSVAGEMNVPSAAEATNYIMHLRRFFESKNDVVIPSEFTLIRNGQRVEGWPKLLVFDQYDPELNPTLDTLEDTVLLDKIEGHFLIGINRPQKRNCVDIETASKLIEAIKTFEKDESNVAILYGIGGNFCAGFDLSQLSKFEDFNNLPSANSNLGPMGPTKMLCSKPVIAAVDGYAVAGGLELALMCDLRVMEETAIMGVFCRRFGVPLIDGGTVRLPQLIGLSRAMDLILTGRQVDGKEAFDFGLANRLVACGTALGQAISLATCINKFPQSCLQADRRSAYYSSYDATSIQDALHYEWENAQPVLKEAVEVRVPLQGYGGAASVLMLELAAKASASMLGTDSNYRQSQTFTKVCLDHGAMINESCTPTPHSMRS
ncbi:hypothetical protein LAZ67_1008067 [Cordylochernes scorpioides]|uniref:HTH CENPB-type domain-containing protein n=1 Tax=Cordylochernes scorpioides TaxID=51811 RepID=A0ABY6K2Q3_9ARAC|nr:hypothetical protein LAZ67_1008067 [Cordylochernes scorpioides]